MPRGVAGMLRFVDLRVHGAERRDRAVIGLLSLVQVLPRVVILLHERPIPLELRFGEIGLRLLLPQVRPHLVDQAVSLEQTGLRAPACRLKITRVHSGKRLAGVYQVPLVHVQLGDSLRELRVDVDLVRLEPPVARDDARRKLRLLELIPADPGPDSERACERTDEVGEQSPKAMGREPGRLIGG